jgi:phosphopantetheine adenylyltransferase
MKNYRQLVKELPSKTIVFAFGRFNPPTSGHELLLKVVQKLAKTNNADHVVYASRTQDKKKNPLSVDRKIHYLKLMFKGINFTAANQNERTFIEAVKSLNKKYKNLIMVAGSDRVPEYEKILQKYNGKEFNYDTIQVVSAGERDPDADDASGMSASKMRAFAVKGNYVEFKKGLPSSVRDIDGRLLMNEIRFNMGLEVVKEQIKFSVDELREKYFKGEIYHIGEVVESNDQQFEIVDRGSNYLVVVDEQGQLHRKWIKDVQIMEIKNFKQFNEEVILNEITYKGYTTKNLHSSESAFKAFTETIEQANNDIITNDPVAILNALKAVDLLMVSESENSLDTLKKCLNKIGVLEQHSYIQTIEEALSIKTIKPNQDKLKVARVIADMLGINDVEKSSNAEQLVNMALRSTRKKTMTKDLLSVVSKMLDLADEVGIKYDSKLRPSKLAEQKDDLITPTPKTSNYNIASDVLRYSDYMKLKKMNGGELPSKETPTDLPHTTPGHALHSSDDPNMRRRKVKYATEDLDKACWKGYEAIGTKKKNGKTVPNCVPKEETEIEEDVASADYKTNKAGKKYRAHRINFANSKSNAKPDSTPNENEDENESKNNLKVEEIVKKTLKVSPVKDDSAQLSSTRGKGFDAFFEEDSDEDIPDNELDKMIDDMTDDDVIEHGYEDDEFVVVDEDTGEIIKEDIQILDEVLSRIERIRSRVRFARTSAKRQRKTKIALKKYSSSSVINNRARKLAIKLMKKRLTRGRDPKKLSVGEKERLEKTIQNRKKIINRLAMRLVPRVRKVEKARLTHTKVTKGGSGAVF